MVDARIYTIARVACPREDEAVLLSAAAAHPFFVEAVYTGSAVLVRLDLAALKPEERGCERLRTERWLEDMRRAHKSTPYVSWLAEKGLSL